MTNMLLLFSLSVAMTIWVMNSIDQFFFSIIWNKHYIEQIIFSNQIYVKYVWVNFFIFFFKMSFWQVNYNISYLYTNSSRLVKILKLMMKYIYQRPLQQKNDFVAKWWTTLAYCFFSLYILNIAKQLILISTHIK